MVMNKCALAICFFMSIPAQAGDTDCDCERLIEVIEAGSLDVVSGNAVADYFEACDHTAFEVASVLEKVEKYHALRERRDLPNSMSRQDPNSAMGTIESDLDALKSDFLIVDQSVLFSVLSFFIDHGSDEATSWTALEILARTHPEKYEAIDSNLLKSDEKRRAFFEVQERWVHR